MWKACYEGTVVAERFYDEGFNVAVLDYRVNPYSQKAAQQDAIRAVRYLRYHAKELNTLPDKIGMMGFSAGAMLTGWCATKFDQGNPEAADPVDAAPPAGRGGALLWRRKLAARIQRAAGL